MVAGLALAAPDAAAPESEPAVVVPRTALVSRIQQELTLALMLSVSGDELAAARFEGRADVYQGPVEFRGQCDTPMTRHRCRAPKPGTLR